MRSLKPVLRIAPPAWMTNSDTAAVIAALNDEKGKLATLFVGGCVRNTLLNRPVDDVDLASIWTPDRVMARLALAGIKAVPTGIDHGTVTAVSGGKGFEVTTLRKDLETDGRHAKVGFTDDWLEDARRRDFTINTLLASNTGEIYDPLGQGLDDLRACRVAFVGDPDQRIDEDRLRILRFFRFYGAYGKGEPDPAALAACTRAATGLSALSRERVTQEILKIIAGPDPASILGLMAGCGVLRVLAGDDVDRQRLRTLCDLQSAHDALHVEARFVALANGDETRLETLMENFVLSKAFRRKAEVVLEALKGVLKGEKPPVLLYHHGLEPSIQAALLAAAQNENPSGVAEKLEMLRGNPRPAFPLSGQDILDRGGVSGPALGQTLRRLEHWWLDQMCKPDRAELLARFEKEPCSNDSQAVKSLGTELDGSD